VRQTLLDYHADPELIDTLGNTALRLKVGVMCRDLSVEESRVIVRKLFPLMVEVQLLDDFFGREETVFVT